MSAQATWPLYPQAGQLECSSSPLGQGQDSGDKGSHDSQKENDMTDHNAAAKLTCVPSPLALPAELPALQQLMRRIRCLTALSAPAWVWQTPLTRS